MKLKKLIKELQKLEKKYGNIAVSLEADSALKRFNNVFAIVPLGYVECEMMPIADGDGAMTEFEELQVLLG